MSIVEAFSTLSALLDQRNGQRERIYQLAHDVTKRSKDTISHLHRATAIKPPLELGPSNTGQRPKEPVTRPTTTKLLLIISFYVFQFNVDGGFAHHTIPAGRFVARSQPPEKSLRRPLPL